MTGGKQGLFLRIESFARRRYGLVFGTTIVLVVVSTLLGLRLHLDGDILNLVPKHNRAVNTFKEAVVDFGSLDYLLLLIEAPPRAAAGSVTAAAAGTAGAAADPAADPADEGHGVEDLQTYAELLAGRLQKLPSIRYVEYKLDTSGPLFDFLRRNQVLFLPPSRIDDLAAKFSDTAIRQRLEEDLRQLTGPASFLSKRILEQDPLQISPLLYEAVIRNRGPIKIDTNGGYYQSRDGTALLLVAKPIRPSQDLSFSRSMVKEVRGAVAEAADDFRRDAGSAEAPAVELGGGYIIGLEDSNLIAQDMKLNGFLSFIAIVLLYYFCYRRVAAILYSAVPLMVGQSLTLAVAWLCLGSLNSATTGFTAMLMGLGTDFTIVMYARYVEERQRGLPLDEALQRMMGASAFGVFTGAITSAGTFYAMCITEYKGLRDFGFLVGTGIMLCMVAILFLLPAMIAWNDGRKRKGDVTGRLYLHSFGLERIMTWSTRHPVPVLAVSLVVTAGACVAAWNVEFSDSVQDLRSAKNRGILLQERIAREFGASFNPMMVVARGPDQQTMMTRNRAANRILDQFVADKTLLGYESIFSYLPPAEDQHAVIAAMRARAGGDFDVTRIERTFRAAGGALGYREGSYDGYLGALPATLRPERPVTLEDLESAGLDRFVRRYVHHEEDGDWTSVTYIFPSAPDAKRHAPPALVAALDHPDQGFEITGANIASAELRRIFKRDAWNAVILGILLVSVLLWLDFRSVWLTALANLQVILGVIWMLAIMQIAGIKMNFVNAFVTTMILGVGIDYGIHIIHRISQEGLSNPAGLLETGKAVIMAAMTNVAGFGTIGLSNYPGLRSMGIVSAIGSVTCLATALTTLPALLIVLRTRVRHLGGSPSES
ncbi:MAG TPA: MMPL family transporter [Patescibacteria group bacterium]|nr:MMPL family transporter [Patescibacteria group bacterium]